MSLIPVYPARHPAFYARCKDCGETKDSPSLFADTDGEAFKAYICAKCVFTFGLLSGDKMQQMEIDRDSRELQNYDNFQG